MKTALFLLSSCLFFLSGCGQSGPLYLPPPAKTVTQTPIPLTET